MTDRKFKVSELMDKVPNKFLLTLATAKRARQIKEGSKILVTQEEEADTPIITALEEFQEDLIEIEVIPSSEDEDTILDEISEYLEPESSSDDKPKDEDSPDDDSKNKKESKKRKSKSLAA